MIFGFFIWLIVLISNGIYFRTFVSWPIKFTVLLSAIILYIIINRKTIVIRKQQLGLYALLIILQLITIIFNGFEIEYDLFLVLSLTFGLIITSCISYEKFIDGFLKLLYPIIIISLLFYAVGYFPVIFHKIPISFLEEINNNFFIIMKTFVIRANENYAYYRNCGLFSEPGQYQLFLNIGLIFELFKRPDKNLKKYLKILLIFVCILTCRSTAGIITTVLIFIAFGINYIRLIDRKKTVYITIFFAMGFILISYFYKNDIIYKISNFNYSYSYSDIGTGLERRRAIDFALSSFFHNPILGIGYKGTHEYMYELNSNGFITTASPINWFAYFGIIYGVVANYLYLKSLTFDTKKLQLIILIVAIITMIITQNVCSDIFTSILLFYGLEMHNLNKIENKQ